MPRDAHDAGPAGRTSEVETAEVKTRASALLDRLVASQGHIQGAVLATADGIPIAFTSTNAALSASRLSAMSSALLGLCTATATESKIGECNDVFIEATAGRLLAMSVDYRGTACVLMTVGEPAVPLGQVLWATRKCAQAIARIA